MIWNKIDKRKKSSGLVIVKAKRTPLRIIPNQNDPTTKLFVENSSRCNERVCNKVANLLCMTVVYQWPPSTKGKKVEVEIKKMKMPNKETFLSGCRLQKKNPNTLSQIKRNKK